MLDRNAQSDDNAQLMGIYELLKAEAAARGSVAALARACNVSKQVVHQWMAEDQRSRINPTPASCKKIADGLGLPLDYVLDVAGHRPATVTDSRVHDELSARIDRVEAILRPYPRVFWASVLDAVERMEEAARTLTPVIPESQEVRGESGSPVSTQGTPPVEAPEREGSRPSWSANHQKKAPSLVMAA